MDTKQFEAFANNLRQRGVDVDPLGSGDGRLCFSGSILVEDLIAALPSDAAGAPTTTPVAWMIDWPDEPELGHYFGEEPNPSGRSVPLYAAPVAPPAPINLEGLRKKLLTPRQIVRDEDGYLTHPDFPICDEGTHAGKFLDAFGIDAEFVEMESDDPAAAERYFEAGEAHCSYWTPTPPEGDGWLLLEIYETEDGPCALFGRDRYEAENALKKKRMREQLDRIQQRQATQGEKQ